MADLSLGTMVLMIAPKLIPLSKPHLEGREIEYLKDCLAGGAISGDGPYTQRCSEFLSRIYGSPALLVHSCTAALEMAALLIGLEPGDEVIMPSFTFVSTANAVVLRGGVPVFVDIRPDTANIDEKLIEAAITPRTRAIFPIHYAGVSAEMDKINALARSHGLFVVEDAAQGYGSSYKGRPLGTLSHLGCLSFHVTKNIVSGEGGAILLNDPSMVDRANYIREKGTNRTQFLRREVAKYEWLDLGSSYLPSDLIAAVLLAQLERADAITQSRLDAWQIYKEALTPLSNLGIRLPSPPPAVEHNAHIFYVIMPSADHQKRVISALREAGITASSHYVPLHSSPAGLRFGRAHGSLSNTDWVASSIVQIGRAHV